MEVNDGSIARIDRAQLHGSRAVMRVRFDNYTLESASYIVVTYWTRFLAC